MSRLEIGTQRLGECQLVQRLPDQLTQASFPLCPLTDGRSALEVAVATVSGSFQGHLSRVPKGCQGEEKKFGDHRSLHFYKCYYMTIF